MRIELRNLEKRFDQVHALRDVSLSIPAGQRTALIGPNGSGKSTLTRALMGILACDGEVLLDGTPVSPDRREIARDIAYVPQVAPHFRAPVGEVLRAVTTVRGIDPGRVAMLAGRLDLDIDPIRRRPFNNLSGGMKQKLLIALALASSPRLLIMDEPTASLDGRSRERFMELVQEVAPGTTMLLCSHRWEELRQLVDHVVAMEEGRVVYSGSAAAWLDARVLSVLEVRLHGGEPARDLDRRAGERPLPMDPDTTGPAGWLAGRGFRAGLEGWWSRTVTHEEKLRLVPALTTALGPQLRDLLVRDLETIDVAAGR